MAPFPSASTFPASDSTAVVKMQYSTGLTLPPQAWVVSQLLLLMSAGLIPARPSAPPPQGPLSYLSTVTTASTSDWGSRSLDGLSQQPSDLANTARPVASQPAPADPGVPSSTASSGGQQLSGGQASSTMRKGLGQTLSRADHSQAKQGRFSSRTSRDDAGQIETVVATSGGSDQGSGVLSQPHSTGAQVVGSSNRVRPDEVKQRQPTGLKARLSSSQVQFQGSGAVDATTVGAAEPAEWDAFGGAARHGHQRQHATPSPTHPAFQSNNGLAVWGTSDMSAAQDEWSAFSDPSSASVEAAPSGLDDSTQEGAQAAADFNTTNPFLEPGQDLYAGALPADSPQVARVASGDSFGDFNAPGEREEDFEGAAWNVPAASAGDMTAAIATADPFAASASFTDFAALLEPAPTQLLGDLDATIADTAALQIPVARQFDLAELQSNHASSLQQGAQTSAKEFPNSARQPSDSGVFAVYLTRMAILLAAPHALTLPLCTPVPKQLAVVLCTDFCCSIYMCRW